MGIKEDLEEIKDVILTEKAGIKEKKFRFPFGKKVSRSQRKKNYIIVLLLMENGTYDFKKYQVQDQTIVHKVIPRLATAGHVMFNKKGQPLIVLPEWSVDPLSPKKHFDKSLENGTNTKGFAILMSKMKSEQVNAKKSMGNIFKWIGGLAFAAIIGYAFLTGAG